MSDLAERTQVWLGHRLARAPDLVVEHLTARRPMSIAGQRLEPRTQHALLLVSRSGRPPLEQLPVARARREYTRFPLVFEDPPLPLPHIEDQALEGPEGPIPIRIYHPRHPPRHPSPSHGRLPVLVYYHGGGGVVGSIETHDGLCRLIARQLRALVVSVEYRLGPEHPFPAAPEDAWAAYRGLLDRIDRLEGDPTRVAVGGDSMGGCLAAVVCQRARDEAGPMPRAQWLIYPATDRATHRPSQSLFGEGLLLTEPMMQWFSDLYLGEADRHDPRASPLHHPNLTGLPPAVVVTAGFDPLRDEGQAYAEALAAAGVPVRHRCHEGLVHGFAQMTGAVPAARRAMMDAMAQLQALLD